MDKSQVYLSLLDVLSAQIRRVEFLNESIQRFESEVLLLEFSNSKVVDLYQKMSSIYLNHLESLRRILSVSGVDDFLTSDDIELLKFLRGLSPEKLEKVKFIVFNNE